MQRIIKDELQLSANMAAEASPREERRRLEREAVCYRCESGKEMPDNQVMLCDNLLCATIAWHQLCLEPPILEIPDGIWFCPICADNGVAERSVTVNEKLREQEPVPGPASVPVIPPRDGPRGKSEKRLGGAGSSSDPLQAKQMPPPRRVAKRVDKVEAAALTNGEPSRHNGAKDSVEALEAEEAMAHETATVLATVKRAPLSARSAPYLHLGHLVRQSLSRVLVYSTREAESRLQATSIMCGGGLRGTVCCEAAPRDAAARMERRACKGDSPRDALRSWLPA